MNEKQSNSNKAIYLNDVLEYFGISRYILRQRLKQNAEISHLLNQKRRRYFTPLEFDLLKLKLWENNENK